jgi:hypothetical protein
MGPSARYVENLIRFSPSSLKLGEALHFLKMKGQAHLVTGR